MIIRPVTQSPINNRTHPQNELKEPLVSDSKPLPANQTNYLLKLLNGAVVATSISITFFFSPETAAAFLALLMVDSRNDG